MTIPIAAGRGKELEDTINVDALVGSLVGDGPLALADTTFTPWCPPRGILGAGWNVVPFSPSLCRLFGTD